MNATEFLTQIAEQAGENSPLIRAVAEVRFRLNASDLSAEVWPGSENERGLKDSILFAAKELALRNLRDKLGGTLESLERIKSKSIFIVYDPEDLSSKAQAQSLAELLRERGHLVEIDPISPTQSQQALTNSDYTLILFGKNHAHSVDSKEKGHKDIKWGQHLAIQAIFDQGSLNHNVIPITAQEADSSSIPTELRAWTRYGLGELSVNDSEDLQSLESLIRRIENRPVVVPAPLGRMRSFD